MRGGLTLLSLYFAMPTPKKQRNECRFCGAECARPTYTYCSNQCQQLHRQQRKIEEGVASPLTWKHYLLRTEGHRCAICRLETWNGHPIPLELDHIDGNASRNVQENLRLLCPNCHAQTATYKNKNVGNGRHHRRLRYAKKESF